VGMSVRSYWVAPLAALFIAGCNLITGSSEFEVVGSGGDASQGGQSADGGNGSGNGPADGGSISAGPSMAECGNDACEGGEDCVTCEADCGACAATCGNESCDADETCINCPGDCGTCAPACGDAVCNGSETCSDCPGDCGACPPTCPNGACDAGETCTTCSQDCGACGPMCGDGTCDAGETCDSCASDCGACSTCGGAGDATTTLDAEEQAFLVLINNYRTANGLGTLTACTSLNRAAQGHSEDMRDQNYFDHTGLNGSSPWDRACDACYELGCGPQTAMAENIAAGNSGAQGTFTQWQNSPGHNANMLGVNFTQIGIGRATGGGMYGSYWTNVFGGATEPSCN
jgi:uncharacterized protein YkwD